MTDDGKIKFEMETLEQMHESLLKCASILEQSGFTSDDAFKVRLVSTELVTNVIRHGHETAEFECVATGDEIVICVTAKSQEDLAFESVDLPRDIFASRGRGMYLVRRYATKVGLKGMTVMASIKTERKEKTDK